MAPSPACAFNFQGTTVTCSLGSIPNGGSTIVIIDVHPITTGTKTLSVQVSAAETDPNAADNTASASPSITGVGISDVQVTLFDLPDPIRVGQLLYYAAQVLHIQDDPELERLSRLSDGCEDGRRPPSKASPEPANEATRRGRPHRSGHDYCHEFVIAAMGVEPLAFESRKKILETLVGHGKNLVEPARRHKRGLGELQMAWARQADERLA